MRSTRARRVAGRGSSRCRTARARTSSAPAARSAAHVELGWVSRIEPRTCPGCWSRSRCAASGSDAASGAGQVFAADSAAPAVAGRIPVPIGTSSTGIRSWRKRRCDDGACPSSNVCATPARPGRRRRVSRSPTPRPRVHRTAARDGHARRVGRRVPDQELVGPGVGLVLGLLGEARNVVRARHVQDDQLDVGVREAPHGPPDCLGGRAALVERDEHTVDPGRPVHVRRHDDDRLAELCDEPPAGRADGRRVGAVDVPRRDHDPHDVRVVGRREQLLDGIAVESPERYERRVGCRARARSSPSSTTWSTSTFAPSRSAIAPAAPTTGSAAVELSTAARSFVMAHLQLSFVRRKTDTAGVASARTAVPTPSRAATRSALDVRHGFVRSPRSAPDALGTDTRSSTRAPGSRQTRIEAKTSPPGRTPQKPYDDREPDAAQRGHVDPAGRRVGRVVQVDVGRHPQRLERLVRTTDACHRTRRGCRATASCRARSAARRSRGSGAASRSPLRTAP